MIKNSRFDMLIKPISILLYYSEIVTVIVPLTFADGSVAFVLTVILSNGQGSSAAPTASDKMLPEVLLKVRYASMSPANAAVKLIPAFE